MENIKKIQIEDEFFKKGLKKERVRNGNLVIVRDCSETTTIGKEWETNVATTKGWILRCTIYYGLDIWKYLINKIMNGDGLIPSLKMICLDNYHYFQGSAIIVRFDGFDIKLIGNGELSYK